MKKSEFIQVHRESFIATINEIRLSHARRPKGIKRAHENALHLVAFLSSLLKVNEPEVGNALLELIQPD